jgi:uncharacterized SAM-binding protein YcdF (DUF218 family)
LFVLFFSKIYQCGNLKNNKNILKKIDAVVVLTGSKGRISEAFKYIHYKNVKFVIISGANPLSSKKDILSHYKKYKKYFNKVIIENLSTNTVENALEVKKISKKLGVKKFLLVTSCTHLPRTKYIFQKIFLKSNITIYFWKSEENITFPKIIKEELKYLFDFFLMFAAHLQ